jgi:hypothetical protein
MTPAQWNEYERQAQVIERNKKWKEQQKQLITEIMELDAKDGLYEDISHRGYPRPDDIDKFEQDREQLKKIESVSNCNQLTTK